MEKKQKPIKFDPSKHQVQFIDHHFYTETRIYRRKKVQMLARLGHDGKWFPVRECPWQEWCDLKKASPDLVERGAIQLQTMWLLVDITDRIYGDV